MSRRQDPKARTHLNEAAATGRRRAQVQEQSSRQRDAVLRSRRLLAELAGSGGEVSEAALAALGPDVLAERVQVVAAALSRWSEAPAAEWQAALQQLVALLSTGSYQPAHAALSGGVLPALAGLLQLDSRQLPPDAARRAYWSLELLSRTDRTAAQGVLQVLGTPGVMRNLSGAMAAAAELVGPGGFAAPVGGGGGPAERLLLADQIAAALGATAAWDPELQTAVVGLGAITPLLQLIMATLGAATEAAAAASAGAGGGGPIGGPAFGAGAAMVFGQGQALPAAGGVDEEAAEPAAVRCCTSGLWALGMLVRGRHAEVRRVEVLQLLSQPALLTRLRRLLLAPSPHLPLLREAAWLLAFCGAGGGPEAVSALVEGGGLVPGLLLSTLRCVHTASTLIGDDPASQDAAQPHHQALLPLLQALTNIAAEPAQALLVLTELQVVRQLTRAHSQPSQLIPSSPQAPGTPPAGGSGSGGVVISSDLGEGVGDAAAAAAAAAGGVLAASGMQALVACLTGRVSHRGVVRGAATLVAALAWGACRAGGVAMGSVRTALRDGGVVAALVGVLRTAALDIRKEAAAALASLCQGAAATADGSGSPGGARGGGDGGGSMSGGLDSGGVEMLGLLGVQRGADEQGVVAAFLALLRSPDADAVHVGLRFVGLVLGGMKHGPQLVESLDGIDALEAVQYGTAGCMVPELQSWAEELVDTYYGEGYGEEDDEEML